MWTPPDEDRANFYELPRYHQVEIRLMMELFAAVDDLNALLAGQEGKDSDAN